jgi:hypothetical protein
MPTHRPNIHELMTSRSSIAFARRWGSVAIMPVLAGCGASDDDQGARTNHCTFTIVGDEASGLGSSTLEIESAIPYKGNELGPLVIGTAQGTRSSFECGKRGPLDAESELVAYFEIGWTGASNELMPFDVVMSPLGQVTSLNVRVQNAAQAWGKCSVSSFVLRSAELVLDDSSTRWYKVHGVGSGQCEQENGAPGALRLGLTF